MFKKIQGFSIAHTELFIFGYFLVIRLLFVFLGGYDNYELNPDSGMYFGLSERVLQGNFNFDVGRFIVAPFYPCFIALHKWLFADFWVVALSASQISISCLSGIYLYRLGRLLFPHIAIVPVLATLLFGIFPMTLWWVHSFATEMWFQSILIICVYYLVSAVLKASFRSLFISALLFSIAFLTKSHILLFAPFIVLFIFVQKSLNTLQKIKFSLTYGLISLFCTLPFGLYNLQKNDTYVLSSNGAGVQFYYGNTNFAYRTIVDVPEIGSLEHKKLVKLEAGYFNGAKYDSILALSQSQKQALFFKEAFQWIEKHPSQFAQLKAYNLFFFMMPGVSWRHHSFLKWLVSIVFSLPVYLLAYWGMVQAFKQHPRLHAWIIFLFLSMVIFSVGMYVQNRFRTITLEPFYILYAAYGFTMVQKKMGIKVKM